MCLPYPIYVGRAFGVHTRRRLTNAKSLFEKTVYVTNFAKHSLRRGRTPCLPDLLRATTEGHRPYAIEFSNRLSSEFINPRYGPWAVAVSRIWLEQELPQ
jgi:hypothetical protein